MTSADSKIRPLLASFEEAVPEQTVTRVFEYDETRMILLADGRPALFEPEVALAGSTKITRVRQETVDDD